MREFSSKQTERMRSNYDASIKTKSFEPGSYVLLYVPKVPKGTYSKWAIFYQGPHKVIRRLNLHNYVVRKTPKSKDLVVHCDRLRPYFAGLQGTPWQKRESAKVHSENSDHVGTDTNVDNSDLTSMHMHEQVGASVTGHEGGQQPITAAAKLSRPRRQARRPARYCQQVEVRRVLCLPSASEEDGRHCSSESSNYSGSKTVVDGECDSIAPRERFIDCRLDRGSNYRRRSVTMSKRASATNSSRDSDAGGYDENGRDGRACGFTDPTGPSGPPPGRGRGRGRRVAEVNRQDESTCGDRNHRPGDRYHSKARGADQPIVVLRDARHLIDDAGTASVSTSTSPDDRYRLHARGATGTSSATDRYPDDARGDRYRDRGDADRYSPGTGRVLPPRNQGADRHSTGDDRAPPTDEPEVPTANRKRQRRRCGGRAFSPRHVVRAVEDGSLSHPRACAVMRPRSIICTSAGRTHMYQFHPTNWRRYYLRSARVKSTGVRRRSRQVLARKRRLRCVRSCCLLVRRLRLGTSTTPGRSRLPQPRLPPRVAHRHLLLPFKRTRASS